MTSPSLRPVAAACLLFILALTATACSKSADDYLARGQEYAKANKYREAIIEYDNAIRTNPQLGEAYLGLGDAQLALGDRNRAAIAFSRAARMLPGNDDAQLKAGTFYLYTRDFEEAQAIADTLLAKTPRNLAAMLLRANALAGLKNVEEALKEIQEAIEIDPDRSDLFQNLGAIEARSGRLQEAEAAFKQAVAVEPNSAQAHSALGSFYWANKRPADAEVAFLKAAELEPTNPLPPRILATFYMSSGRPLEAGRFLKAMADLSGQAADRLRLADYSLLYGKRDEGVAVLKTLVAQPETFSGATNRLAADAYAQGRSDEAHRLLDQLLVKFPNDAYALLLKARFLAKEGKRSDALARAQQAVTADPGLAAGHYFLGWIYREQGDSEKAAASFTRVLQLNPSAAAAQLQLSRLSLATGKDASAIAFAELAIRNSGGNPVAQVALVRALLESGNLTRAEKELAALRQQFPNAAPVDALTGNLLLRKNDYVGAKRALESAFAKDPNSLDTLSNLVAIDLVNKAPGAAQTRVTDALSRNPRSPALLILAARTYGATGDLSKAEDALKRAVSADSSALDAYAMLAQLYYQQGRLAEGQREFERLAKEAPMRVSAETMLGIIEERQDNIPEAIAHYEQALAINPESPVAANNLAWMLVSQGRELDRALQLASVARQGMPDEPGVADTLGWIQHKKGFDSRAVPLLLEAVQNEPTNPIYRYHLGAVYVSQGEIEKARAELTQSLKLSQDFAEAADARKLLASIK